MVDGFVMEWIGGGGVVHGGVVDGSVMEWIGGWGSTWCGGRRVCNGVDRGRGRGST